VTVREAANQMQPPKLATNTRKVVRGDEAQAAIKEGVMLAFDVAAAAYGPTSGNVGIEAQYGDPHTSHDGVFNLDHLHVTDPAVNIAVRTIVQASRSTNVHVGDGTTAATLLAASVYEEAVALVASTSESRMSVARKIKEAARLATLHIDTMKVTATEELLHNVAIISASDEAVGNLVADTVQEIGADGGVIVENFGGAGIYNDIVSGFYFRRGFTNAATLTDPSNLESRFDKVFVLVCEKQLSNIGDIGPILDKCIDANIRELVLIGDVQTEALAVAVKLRLEGRITTTIVDAPEYGAMRTLFMDDLALYVGGKVLNGGANPKDFSVSMLGAAKVVVNEFSTTLIDGERTDEGQEAALQARIDELTAELRVSQSPIEQEAVRGRLGRLTGRIAILRVGGNTEVEQQEVKLRVEDAVAALQAAIKDGVVPGGGVTLARLPDNIPFKHAFEQPLQILLANAGLNSDRGLWQVQEAKDWMGFDLRDDKMKLVNLKKAGVVDPTMVIKEVVNNGFSVAAELIKMTVLLPFDNREAKRG
jgi:chaperonin GroEL